MERPKILIQKRKIFDSKGWRRYYSQAKIDLNKYPIYTEKQLCWIIYKTFGEGHYMIVAWKKGRSGFWLFWIGEINKDGFHYQPTRMKDRREIKSLYKELEEETDEEYKSLLKEMIHDEIENAKKRKMGFTPYLKASSKHGRFVFWEDD